MTSTSYSPHPRWMLVRRLIRSAASRLARSNSGDEEIVMFGVIITWMRPSARPCQESAKSTAWRSCASRNFAS